MFFSYCNCYTILSTHEIDVDIFLIYQGRWLAGFIYSPKLLSVNPNSKGGGKKRHAPHNLVKSAPICTIITQI